MDKYTKYIIFAFAGWLLFSVSSPTYQIIYTTFNELGIIDNGFIELTLTFLRIITQLIGLITVFVFTTPILFSAWKQIQKLKTRDN